MAITNIKGYIFEYFVRKLLQNAGFQQVFPDDNIIYKSSAGIMIHGLGQSHNADVLVSPPIQIPFYFQTRLLIECKCYTEPLGLPFVRNVLGLREDINSFDIVTPEILRKRRNYRRSRSAVFDFDRYIYQVALASISGFKETAEEFAAVHRIPLISFSKSKIFEPIRNFINSSDSIVEGLTDHEKDNFIKILKGEKTPYQYHSEDCHNNFDSHSIIAICEFFDNVQRIAEDIVIGILENGTILFMYAERRNSKPNYEDDDFRLFWSDDKISWKIETNTFNYYFELPDNLMREWDKKIDNWNYEYDLKMQTLRLKEKYFPKIALYSFKEGKPKIEIIEISKHFIKSAVSILNENQQYM